MDQGALKYNLRKTILLIAGVILIIFLIFKFIRYETTGKIIITSNNSDATISLAQAKTDDESKVSSKVYTGHGKLSLNLRSGEYVATVTGNSIAATKLVKVAAHKTSSYAINPPNATGVSPVLYASAQNMAASAERFVYLDGVFGTINSIGVGNIPKKIGSLQMKTVEWADSSFGVGQDSDGRLYIIDVPSNKVTPLSVPFSYQQGRAVAYSVSQNKQIYISSGPDVYLGNASGGFKKIYTATTNTPVLEAGPKSVFVNDNPGEGQGSDGKKQPAYIAVVDSSGLKAHNDFEVNVASWSPSGKYIVTGAETGAFVLDANLKIVTTLPTTAFVSHFSWLNDDTLFFAVEDQVWTYNIKTEESKLLANMPLGHSVFGLATSSDDKYVYMSSGDNDGNVSVIRRVGLDGQNTPDYIYGLQSVMPIQLTGMTMSLIDFAGKPVIYITAFSGLDSDIAMTTAKTELRNRGFDINKFSFVINRQNRAD